MSRFAHGLTAAALGAALGVQVFLSFLVAPAAFRLLDRPAAVRVMEDLFPGYYAFGLTAGGLALALGLGLALAEGRAPLRWAVVILLAALWLGTMYAGHVLLPTARAARLRAQAAAAGDLAPLEFSRLHRRAVALNIALFGIGALTLLVHAAARPPDPAPRP
jgi:hypothetical protein